MVTIPPMNHATLAEFCRRHNIVELGIFGSGARGELRPDSDIDVLVTFSDAARWDLFDFATMQAELKEICGRPVDLVERGSLRNPFRRRSILRDLTVLYAA